MIKFSKVDECVLNFCGVERFLAYNDFAEQNLTII